MSSIYLSPCPNDTYAICALAQGHFAPRACWQIELHEIETLNRKAKEGRPGIYKVSFATLPKLKRHRLLACGMALTETAGPVLVSRKDCSPLKILAIPGEGTTAAWLARQFAPAFKERVSLRYDLIPAAIASGQVDAGVLIHEARFTYASLGLQLLIDLGQSWQQAVGAPLVLACLVATDDLPVELTDAFTLDYRKSLRWAKHHLEQALPFIASHAQEQEPWVIQAHIEHFVSKQTDTPTPELFQAVERMLYHGSIDFCHLR